MRRKIVQTSGIFCMLKEGRASLEVDTTEYIARFSDGHYRFVIPVLPGESDEIKSITFRPDLTTICYPSLYRSGENMPINRREIELDEEGYPVYDDVTTEIKFKNITYKYSGIGGC